MTNEWSDEDLRRILSGFDRSRTPAADARERIRARMFAAYDAGVRGSASDGSDELDGFAAIVPVPVRARARSPRRHPVRVLVAVALLLLVAATVAVVAGTRRSGDDRVTVASPLVGRVAEFCDEPLPVLVDGWRLVRADGDLLVAANLEGVLAGLEVEVAPLLDDLRGEGVGPSTVDRIAALIAAARGTFDSGELTRTAELLDAIRLELRIVFTDPDLPGGTSCDATGL